MSWTVKEDDFFPYASDPYAYWTGNMVRVYALQNWKYNYTIGYFTSRPALKFYARKMNSLLQICKQVEMMGEVNKLHKLQLASSQRLRELTKLGATILNSDYDPNHSTV